MKTSVFMIRYHDTETEQLRSVILISILIFRHVKIVTRKYKLFKIKVNG